MKKFLIIIMLLLPLTVAGQNINIRITHGPYLCDMTSDGVTVVWTTNIPALSWVEIADDGKNFYAKERPRYYDTRNGRKSAYKTLHKVRINGLQPGKQYVYRAYSREVTEWIGADKVSYGNTAASSVKGAAALSFRTYDDKALTSSFFVINDVHGKSDKMKKLCSGVDFKPFDFVLLNGDMATHFKTEEQVFKNFVDASVELFASRTPIIYGRGNHECRGPLADVLIDYFPTRSGEFYQLYRVGKIAYLVLDGGEDKPDSDIEYGGLAAFDNYREEQGRWLEEIVRSPEFTEATVRIVFLHIPPLHGDGHGNQHMARQFLPALNKAGIDLMFSGHLHRYQHREPTDKVHFPIIVNDADSYIKCQVSEQKIDLEIVSSVDPKIKRLSFPVSKKQ